MNKLIDTKATNNAHTKETRKAEVVFKVTEVEGRSKSAPISRQGCISSPLS